VRQTLYSGGGVRAALDSQSSLREAVRRELEGVVNTAILEVRTRFYDVLLAREQIKVQEQNITLLREQLQTAKNRFEAGAVSNFDVLRAEVELANALPELIRARNSFRTAVDALRFSLGYVNPSPGTIAKVPEFIGTLDYTPVEFQLDSTLETARANRPELLRLAAVIDAQDANVRFSRSGYLPDLALVGGYGLRKSNFSESFADSLDGWTIGLQSSWAIFDGKRTAGQVAQARSQLAQSELQLDEFGLAVEVEVRRALSAFQEAGELVDAAEKVVEQAHEALRLANSRYGAGTATQLDVLTTQVSLVRAQLNKLQAVYNYNVSVARVRQAAGIPDPLVRFDPAS
ncbi:MAG TPA: TolC family protein, partial [Opitutaceae bacterium]